MARPGRKGLCGQTISEIGCSNLAVPQGETTPVWTCARRSCLTLGSLPVDSWPQPGSPFLIFPPPHLCPGRLTNSRPPGRPDLPTTSAQTSSLKAVWMRLCTFQMGFSPGSRGLALALAWPLIYHSLKLSYSLPVYRLPPPSGMQPPRGQGLYLPCALP